MCEDRVHKLFTPTVHQASDCCHELIITDRVVVVPVEHVEEQVNIIELDTNAIVLAAFFKLKSRELSRAILIQDLEESPKAEDPSSTTLIHLLPEFI